MKVKQMITLCIALMSSVSFLHGQNVVEEVNEEKTQKEITIKLPKVGPHEVEKADLVIDISADRKFSIKGEKYTSEELKKHLAKLVKEKQDLFTILRFHRNVLHKDAMSTIGLIHSAGAKNVHVGIAVEAEEKISLDDEKNLNITDFKEHPNAIVIEILNEKEITIEGKKYTHDELKKYLAELSKINKNQPVRLRGDEDTPYNHIVKTIDSCRKGGIWNISFATKKPSAK